MVVAINNSSLLWPLKNEIFIIYGGKECKKEGKKFFFLNRLQCVHSMHKAQYIFKPSISK